MIKNNRKKDFSSVYKVLILFAALFFLIIVYNNNNYQKPISQVKPTLTPTHYLSITPMVTVYDQNSDNPSVDTSNDIVKLSLSKTRYFMGDIVEVGIENLRQDTILFYDGPSCGVTFERKVNGNWKFETISSIEESFAPCFLETIKSNEKRVIKRTIDTDPPSGIYRAKFSYEKSVIYSQEFIIM